MSPVEAYDPVFNDIDRTLLHSIGVKVRVHTVLHPLATTASWPFCELRQHPKEASAPTVNSCRGGRLCASVQHLLLERAIVQAHSGVSRGFGGARAHAVSAAPLPPALCGGAVRCPRLALMQPPVQALAQNEHGRRIAAAPTLFYLPHCEASLCCNILEANASWLERVAILGNSFTLYQDRYKAMDASLRQER